MKELGVAYDIYSEINKSPVYRKKQLETHIGERLNTLLNRTIYDVKDGKIFGHGEEESFLEVMKSGVGHGKLSDRPREEAEIVGFSKIEGILAKGSTPEGTMMVSISPRGNKQSVYQHNFYDVFKKKGNQIEAHRYSAGLSWDEFGEKAKELGFEGDATDVSFLSNPMLIDSRFQTPDEVHNFFHTKHEYISEEDYLLILKLCLPSILYYANSPSEESFNAVLNKADYVKENLEAIKIGKLYYLDIATKGTIASWGSLPVREVATGCGYSAGASSESPFGVSNLAHDKYGNREFSCPYCGETNRRPKDELIENCQWCNKSVRC